MSAAATSPATDPVELVGLAPLLAATVGDPDVVVAVLDGPVATGHPDLVDATLRPLPGGGAIDCADPSETGCAHGTFVTGILAARRGSAAPAICPGCTVLVSPVFHGSPGPAGPVAGATPIPVADAIVASVDAGAQVINLSGAVHPAARGPMTELRQALDHARAQGVIVVVAAGNHAGVGGTLLTCHPAAIPVVGYASPARPSCVSDLGASIGRRGLGGPATVTSLTPDGAARSLSGSSFAAPFVTGAIALLLSEFPGAPAGHVAAALIRAGSPRRSIAPPLLDGAAAQRSLATTYGRK